MTTSHFRPNRVACFLAGGLLAGGLLTGACHPDPKPKNPDRLIGKGAERVDPTLLPKRSVTEAKGPPNPPSYPLATIPDKSVGPFLARRAGTAMAAYVGPAKAPDAAS